MRLPGLPGILVLWLCLAGSLPSHAQERFVLVSSGYRTEVVGDPADYEREGAEWVLQLYRKGEANSGNHSWGEFSQDCSQLKYADLMIRLKAHQAMEQAYELSFGDGTWGPETYFNAGVPELRLHGIPSLKENKEWQRDRNVSNWQTIGELQEYKNMWDQFNELKEAIEKPYNGDAYTMAEQLGEDFAAMKKALDEELERNLWAYAQTLQKNVSRIAKLNKDLDGNLSAVMESQVNGDLKVLTSYNGPDYFTKGQGGGGMLADMSSKIYANLEEYRRLQEQASQPEAEPAVAVRPSITYADGYLNGTWVDESSGRVFCVIGNSWASEFNCEGEEFYNYFNVPEDERDESAHFFFNSLDSFFAYTGHKAYEYVGQTYMNWVSGPGNLPKGNYFSGMTWMFAPHQWENMDMMLVVVDPDRMSVTAAVQFKPTGSDVWSDWHPLPVFTIKRVSR